MIGFLAGAVTMGYLVAAAFFLPPNDRHGNKFVED